MPANDFDSAIATVKSAIERIKTSQAEFEISSLHTRDSARMAASFALREFAYQWYNVDLIIREKNL